MCQQIVNLIRLHDPEFKLICTFAIQLYYYKSDQGFHNHTTFTVCIRIDRPEQTVLTQMRRRKMQHLIKVYTVCHSASNF